MENLLTLVDSANSVLWNVILIVLLCGTGIYYTIRLKFIQIRKFPEGLKHVFGNLNLNGEKGNNGEMTPFQSVATAIAAQVGTGNLAGAATALVGGGPGAIFWMWLSAFFGMATIYAEATLAQEYKTVEHGEVTGGPVLLYPCCIQRNFWKSAWRTLLYLHYPRTWIHGKYGTVQFHRSCICRSICSKKYQYPGDCHRSCSGSADRLHLRRRYYKTGCCC